MNFSSFATSENLAIDNALQFFNPALGVESAEFNTLFFYDVNYTDLDGDAINFSDNSTLFNITNEGIINFTPTTSGNITVNITLSQNPNVTDILTIEVSDSLAPTVTAISASSSGTTTVTVTLSVTTDETAICNFATTDINFSSMAQMSTTSSTSHSNSQSFTSDTSGTYYVRCNDATGNVMGFSNSTGFGADVQEQPPGSGNTGGSGSMRSGGNSGWQCRYEVLCGDWSECIDGKQARECSNVAVIPFYSDTKCEYLLKQETKRACPLQIEEAPAEEQEGGYPEPENAFESAREAPLGPTGSVIFSDLMGNLRPRHGLIALIVIAALSLWSYAYFRRPSSELTPEEMKKLNTILKKDDLENLNDMMDYYKYLRNKR